MQAWQVCWDHHLVSVKELRSVFSKKSLNGVLQLLMDAGCFFPSTGNSSKCMDDFISTELWVSALLRNVFRGVTHRAIQMTTPWRKQSLWLRVPMESINMFFLRDIRILISFSILGRMLLNECHFLTARQCFVVLSAYFHVGIWTVFHFFHYCYCILLK